MNSMLALLVPSLLAAQEPQEIARNTFLFSTPAGNVVASITPEGAFLIGALSASSTPAIEAAIARRTSSPVRYVIVAASPVAVAEGEAGWRRLGATVVAQEALWARMPEPLRPQVAFSEFIKFVFGGEDNHVVHQQPGHSDADVLVHFENASIVYLGESLPGNGYPDIDTAHGGTIDGLINTINPWAGSGRNRMVGAHGPPMTGNQVREFRDMLTAMRDRIRSLAESGRSAEQVVAARPSAEFDARWGRGRVSPEAFVRAVYRSVTQPRRN